MSTDSMEILSPLQRGFIKAFARTPISGDFFLTGGTALSAFYLKHRYSDDIDLFTEQEHQVQYIVPALKRIAKEMHSKIEFTKEFTTFIEAFLSKKDETVKIHFAQDAPYRLQEVVQNEKLGISIDNELDIACNKMSALFDRYAEKDFVDLYFLSKEFMAFNRLFERARKKHVGMDEYWMAVALKNVDKIAALPRMIKPVTIEELKEFYYQQIEYLMNINKNRREQ
jgi:hypothetical protein